MKNQQLTIDESSDEAQTVSVPSNIDALIAQAIKSNANVETLERIFAMRRELRAEWAEEQFNVAMAKFQAVCPEIKKTKEVRTASGSIAYMYAPIEDIVRQVKSLLTEHGFSYSIKTETLPESVRSTCVVKHRDGHTESRDVQVPLGTKTNVMSASQVVAAALTFASRYAFCNSFGIMTANQDNNAEQEEEKNLIERISQTPKIFKDVVKHLGLAEKLSGAQIMERTKTVCDANEWDNIRLSAWASEQVKKHNIKLGDK